MSVSVTVTDNVYAFDAYVILSTNIFFLLFRVCLP